VYQAISEPRHGSKVFGEDWIQDALLAEDHEA
jgi:hypothetical protein